VMVLFTKGSPDNHTSGGPGWSEPEPWSYNLRASDSSLCDFFLRWITDQRESQGIKSTVGKEGKRGRNPSNRNRPVSWERVEIVDRDAQFHETGFDDCERSRKSQAKREILSLQDSFIKAWKHIDYLRTRYRDQSVFTMPWESHPLFTKNGKHIPFFADFIR
jgi:hypothetical protein